MHVTCTVGHACSCAYSASQAFDNDNEKDMLPHICGIPISAW